MEISSKYYKIALSHAKNRDLTAALQYAGVALKNDIESEKARHLLGLCLYELGALEDAAEAFSANPDLAGQITSEKQNTDRVLDEVRLLISRKKWRKARKLMRTIPRQSVRVLLIRGCISAAMKKYSEAAALFALSMEKDRGNRTAIILLMEAARHYRGMWGRYEKLL